MGGTWYKMQVGICENWNLVIITSSWIVETFVQLKDDPLDTIFNLGPIDSSDKCCPFVSIIRVLWYFVF